MDFHIQEPGPFDPKWLSHKFEGPGMQYEVVLKPQLGGDQPYP